MLADVAKITEMAPCDLKRRGSKSLSGGRRAHARRCCLLRADEKCFPLKERSGGVHIQGPFFPPEPLDIEKGLRWTTSVHGQFPGNQKQKDHVRFS